MLTSFQWLFLLVGFMFFCSPQLVIVQAKVDPMAHIFHLGEGAGHVIASDKLTCDLPPRPECLEKRKRQGQRHF